MANDPQAASVDGTPASKAGANKTYTQEEVSNLHRQLQKQREQNRTLMSQLLETRGMATSLDQIGELIQTELTRRGEEGDEEAKTALSSYTTKAAQGKAYQAAAKAIADLFIDHDTDWSDERFTDAHAAWESGNVQRAVELVGKALGGTDQKPDFDAAVEAAVAKALGKSGKVTTKEGSASTPGQPGVSRETLVSFGKTPKGAAALATEFGELLDSFYKK